MQTERNAAMKVRTSLRHQAGMTLLEIMIVLAILALVMAVLVGPRVLDALSDAEEDTTQMLVNQLAHQAFAEWRVNNRGERCPDSLDDLLEYVNANDTMDAWGNELVMRCGSDAPEGAPFGVMSPGEDGEVGTDDDIRSWD